MDLYFKSDKTKKRYCLKNTPNGAFLFWVQVIGHENGSYIHARGCDTIESFEKGIYLMETIATKIDRSEYLNSMKDYFYADKMLREEFLKNMR